MKISSFMSWKTGPFLLSKKTTQSQNTLCGKQSSLKSQGWKFMLFTFLSKSIKNAVWFLTKQHPSAIKASRFWQPWASNLRPCEDIWVHQETFKYSSLVQPLLKHKHKTKCSQYCLKTLDKNFFFSKLHFLPWTNYNFISFMLSYSHVHIFQSYLPEFIGIAWKHFLCQCFTGISAGE